MVTEVAFGTVVVRVHVFLEAVGLHSLSLVSGGREGRRPSTAGSGDAGDFVGRRSARIFSLG